MMLVKLYIDIFNIKEEEYYYIISMISIVVYYNILELYILLLLDI